VKIRLVAAGNQSRKQAEFLLPEYTYKWVSPKPGFVWAKGQTKSGSSFYPVKSPRDILRGE